MSLVCSDARCCRDVSPFLSICCLDAQDVTAIEKRLYQGRPNAIQVDWTSNGEPMSDLFTRFPFRDDALRHMLALWHRGELTLAKAQQSQTLVLMRDPDHDLETLVWSDCAAVVG